jgi:carboxyl-terminal processing protease
VLEGLKDAPALVLDLRGNPGGLKDEAQAVAELLLPPGTPLLLEEQREGGSTTRAGPGAGADSERPMVVLVDERTGSAAEILAGALQSAGRATVVGETTRGKGVSQAVRLLPGGYSLAVTAARTFDPTGRPLDEGVQPQTGPAEPGSADPALDKAREILEKP